MNTGIKIRVLRESKNISREIMSQLLSMSPNTFSKIESGEKSPPLKEIQLISKELGVDPTLFMEEKSVFFNNIHNSTGIGNGNTVSID